MNTFPIGPLLLGYFNTPLIQDDKDIKIKANFLIDFGVHMNILFIIRISFIFDHTASPQLC